VMTIMGRAADQDTSSPVPYRTPRERSNKAGHGIRPVPCRR
jgi:hypothetical protein